MNPNREVRMSVHKVIEVLAQSDKGWEDAARKAVPPASHARRP